MTILSVIRNVTMFISLSRPDVVFSSTEREHLELQALANKSAQYIAGDYEWQALKTMATLAGDGATMAFPFPNDYERMLKKAELWSSRLATPLTHVVETDHWLELDIRQFGFAAGAWSIFGDRINIKPAPVSGEVVKFFYMSSKWASDNAGVPKVAFTNDDDDFRLSERLLGLCMVWQWKAAKKLPYAQEQDDYENEKEKLIAADKGSRILRVGRARLPRDVNVAYPIAIVP
jgi:hypothetical protein